MDPQQSWTEPHDLEKRCGSVPTCSGSIPKCYGSFLKCYSSAPKCFLFLSFFMYLFIVYFYIFVYVLFLFYFFWLGSRMRTRGCGLKSTGSRMRAQEYGLSLPRIFQDEMVRRHVSLRLRARMRRDRAAVEPVLLSPYS